VDNECLMPHNIRLMWTECLPLPAQTTERGQLLCSANHSLMCMILFSQNLPIKYILFENKFDKHPDWDGSSFPCGAWTEIQTSAS